MNNIKILIAVFSLFGSDFSEARNGDCEGVTVGSCLIKDEDKIDEVEIFTNVSDCQFYCHGTVNCQVFQYDKNLCTLVTRDYRRECDIIGAPFDKSIANCLEINHDETCDLFIEEQCSYKGRVILRTPPGSVLDPQRCEDYCVKYHESLKCQYWEYDNYNKTCTLYDSVDRKCTALGGPRDPSFDSCFSNLTTTSPMTPTTTSTHPSTKSTTSSTTTKSTSSSTAYSTTSTTSNTIKDLSGCSAVSDSNCIPEDDVIIEKIENVVSADYCQFFCDVIYYGLCEYFAYNTKTTTCSIIYEQDKHVCSRIYGGIKTDIDECDPIFDDDVYEHLCYNFKEHLCTYTGNIILIEANVSSEKHCQETCRGDSSCIFFMYDFNAKECQLIDSDERDCDMIRGTPRPDYDQCVFDGNIHWP